MDLMSEIEREDRLMEAATEVYGPERAKSEVQRIMARREDRERKTWAYALPIALEFIRMKKAEFRKQP